MKWYFKVSYVGLRSLVNITSSFVIIHIISNTEFQVIQLYKNGTKKTGTKWKRARASVCWGLHWSPSWRRCLSPWCCVSWSQAGCSVASGSPCPRGWLTQTCPSRTPGPRQTNVLQTINFASSGSHNFSKCVYFYRITQETRGNVCSLNINFAASMRQ